MHNAASAGGSRQPAAPRRAVLRHYSDGDSTPPRPHSDSAAEQPPANPLQQKTNAASFDGSAASAQSVRDRTLAHSEWEAARIEELSMEIRKLLDSNGDQQPPATAATDCAAADAQPPGQGGTSGKSSGRVTPRPRIPPGRPEADSVLNGLDLSQPLNLYRVPDGVMQVFVIGIHPSTPVNRPYVVVRLGDQVHQTSVSKLATGNWNESFELVVSYHMQLFGTVHMDVYSSNTLLPDTLIGRAEVKLSLLEGFPEIFTSYYEIWDRKLAASTVPEQRQRSIVSKNLGALQVRINYRFQRLEDPEPKAARVRGPHISGTVPSQLVNKLSGYNGGGTENNSAAAMSTEDLVAAFANEYNQNMELMRKHGHRAILRSGSTSAAEGPGGKVGFTKLDDDAAPPDPETASAGAAETSAKDGGNWFMDLFAGSQTPDKAASAAGSEKSRETDPGDPAELDFIKAEAAKAPTSSEKTLMQSLTSMFISPSTFMAIKSLERLVGLFNQGVELSNTELLGGLLTLYKFYNEADIPGVSRPHKGTVVEGVRDLELPGRYSRFALASYGWRALYFFNRGITLMDGAKVNSDVTSVLQYLGIAQEDLLGYEFRSTQLFCPSYFVAHDRQKSGDAVVLVVRGTMSAEDTVVDLSCEYTKWNGGLVHSGMKASAQWLFLEVMPQIFAYAKSQDIRAIRIVGHSLGASTAAILAIMILESRSRLCGLGITTDDFDISAYCFGPAPCVSENIADRYRDSIYTYINRDDMVPRLCYGSMSDFKRMSISAADEADNLAQRLYAPFEDTQQQKQRWTERFRRLMNIRHDILATQENLHLALPGTTYHIVSDKTWAATPRKSPSQSLDVAIARRQLFAEATPPRPTKNSSASPPPPPPSTPMTVVQQDEVDTEDLADAINTPLRTAFDVPDRGPAEEPQLPPKAPLAPKAGEKFVPVWVQQVSSDSFREIILRPTIITDHMPSAYELALARAIETQVYERQLRERRDKPKN
ncbi:hypothetical protein GGF46_000200 [Coemansia sp. RSA 552]|nr:hypothetical protein GGF46_000200 [Coemansia sp. RSA 552]